MPWKEQTVEKLREEFIASARTSMNLSKLCREFGISRPTGYKWLARAKQGEPMIDRSRAPHRVTRKTPTELEQAILEIRAQNPAWGGKKIRQVMANKGEVCLPCAKTFQNILKRNGCVSPEESSKHTAYTRFEKETCNEMWQTDIKGDFALGDGSRCYPLTILDDHSRFSLGIAVQDHTRGVREYFKQVFMEYGLPDAILSDNGTQFGGFRQGITKFEKWLMEEDVLPIHGRIRHPQTQGKIERFHRTMKQEVLRHRTFANLKEADDALQEWRWKYNTIRPHEAIGMKCPNEVYQASKRPYNPTVRPYEYGGQYHVIKVNSWGYVRFNRFQVYLSETMIGEYIEFRPNFSEDTFGAYFRNYRIAEFDVHSGQKINNRIVKL